MSGGPVGNGKSYWMSIRVQGVLDQADIQKLRQEIDKIITGKVNGKDVKGKIQSEARARDNSATVTLNVSE